MQNLFLEPVSLTIGLMLLVIASVIQAEWDNRKAKRA